MKGMFHAIMMDNPDRDNLLVFGYIRDCFKKEEFKHIQQFPDYLIRLIGTWICNEWIHLIRLDGEEERGMHWKIRLDDILESITL